MRMVSLRSRGRRVVILAALAVAGIALSTPSRAAGAQMELVRAGNPGQIVDLPGGRGEGELLRLDARLVTSLLALAPEEDAAVADWPVAPGVRRSVRLARHEGW